MTEELIGLSGTNGSGKDTVGNILATKYNFMFISVTDLLRAEASRRGLPVERENLRMISAEWRREKGLGVLIDKALETFEQLRTLEHRGLVIASLRNPGEADRIHELGGTVAWVDADAQQRYDRIQANAATRHRAEEDNISFEQFLSQEAAEMHSSGDSATLNMAGVKDKADIFIDNGSSDLAVLEQALNQALNLS